MCEGCVQKTVMMINDNNGKVDSQSPSMPSEVVDRTWGRFCLRRLRWSSHRRLSEGISIDRLPRSERPVATVRDYGHCTHMHIMEVKQ